MEVILSDHLKIDQNGGGQELKSLIGEMEDQFKSRLSLKMSRMSSELGLDLTDLDQKSLLQ